MEVDKTVREARECVRKQPVKPSADGADYIKREMINAIEFAKSIENTWSFIFDITRFEGAMYLFKIAEEELIDAYQRDGYLNSNEADLYRIACSKYFPILKQYRERWIRRTGFLATGAGPYHVFSQDELLFGKADPEVYKDFTADDIIGDTDGSRLVGKAKIPKFD